MPKVEVEEEDFLRSRRLSEVVGAILKNPKAKLLVEQAHRMVDPNAPTPDLDRQQAIAEPIDEVRKELADLKKQREEEKAENEKQSKLSALGNQVESGLEKLRRGGWTEKGVEGVRELMNEKGIVDVDVAAAYFEKQHPPSSPTTPGGTGSWNFLETPADGGDDIKKLIETRGESTGLVDKLAHEALAEVRGQQRR